METNFSSSIIANYFLLKDKSMKNDVMKVLKLVYISHGFHLALTNDPLIKENVMAWQYGPVIPELYFQLKADNLQCFQEEQLRLNENNKLHQF